MNIQVDPTSSNLASAMLNAKIRPRAVVGYGVKIFHPSPPNYVTRSPGKRTLSKEHQNVEGVELPSCQCRIYGQGLVSRGKYGKLFAPGKPFEKLRPACFVKLIFSYLAKVIKIYTSAKFRASRRLHF